MDAVNVEMHRTARRALHSQFVGSMPNRNQRYAVKQKNAPVTSQDDRSIGLFNREARAFCLTRITHNPKRQRGTFITRSVSEGHARNPSLAGPLI